MRRLRNPTARMVVDLASLERNVTRLRALHARGELMAVVKANAYGAGAVSVARFLQERLGQRLFGVARLAEGVELRRAGIRGRILVFCPPPSPGAALDAYVDDDLEMTVASLAGIQELCAAAGSRALGDLTSSRVPSVHVKFDTGMGRVGVVCANAGERERAFDLLTGPVSERSLKLAGVYSHLCSADDLSTPAFFDRQVDTFTDVVAECTAWAQRHAISTPQFHLCNTAGLLRGRAERRRTAEVPASLAAREEEEEAAEAERRGNNTAHHFDFARTGLGMYMPCTALPLHTAARSGHRGLEQECCMTVRAPVTVAKDLAPGHSVGYAQNYFTRAAPTERLLTVAAGYGDGYLRCYGPGGAHAYHEPSDSFLPVVGNVSMDQITLSAGATHTAPCVSVGDEVVLLGGTLATTASSTGVGTREEEGCAGEKQDANSITAAVAYPSTAASASASVSVMPANPHRHAILPSTLGRWGGTIDYETTTIIPSRVVREYVYRDEPVVVGEYEFRGQPAQQTRRPSGRGRPPPPPGRRASRMNKD